MKGCDEGSNPFDAFEYIWAQGGLDTEMSYPYEKTNVTEECRYKQSNIGAKVVGIGGVLPGNEADLQHAVATKVDM